jgi:Tfp pilus assembly protein PilZ
MAQYFERRAAARINYKSPIRVENLKGIIYNARIVNYSNTGLYIETDWMLKPGTEIYIEMEKSPYSPSNFDLSERRQSLILWQTKLKDSFYGYGYGIKYIPNVDEKPLQIRVLKETEITEENRQYPRRHLSRSVFFVSKNNYFEGLINNLSKNGMFIETRDDFSVGQTVRLVIPGTKIDHGTMLKGEIKHLNRKGIGVQFKKILKIKINRSSNLKKSNGRQIQKRVPKVN